MPTQLKGLVRRVVMQGSALGNSTLGVLYIIETQLDPALKLRPALKKLLATAAIPLEHLLRARMRSLLPACLATVVLHALA